MDSAGEPIIHSPKVINNIFHSFYIIINSFLNTTDIIQLFEEQVKALDQMLTSKNFAVCQTINHQEPMASLMSSTNILGIFVSPL